LEDQIKMDFSYELDPKLKIDLPSSSHPKAQKDETKKEFEDLKNKMQE
jgi:hypothetical protein